MLQERDRRLARRLREHGLADMSALRAFEAGCGEGRNLRELLQWGADPENLAGIDLDASRIERGLQLQPRLKLEAGSAERIAQPDATFDVSLAFTLFSSVPDDEVAAAIAAELLRITRPAGLILVYDMRRYSPNTDVRSISRPDVRRWFPGCDVSTESLTLAPPLARYVVPGSSVAYGLMTAMPFLRTHEMHAIVRPPRVP